MGRAQWERLCLRPVLPPVAEQRWQLPSPVMVEGPKGRDALASATGLPPELVAVLMRRGLSNKTALKPC